MDIKVTDLRLVHEYGNGWRVSALVDMDSSPTAKRMVDEMKDKTIRLSAKEWREHRSLTANAYFHVLVGKIAEKMNLGEDEVKRSLVLDYGAQARDKDGNPIWINLPRGILPESLGVKYSKWFNTTEVRGKTHDCYIVFGQTHTYDTKEFSRLLDGTIREAKELGIETLPPMEIERMMRNYAQEDKSTCDLSAS